MIGREHKWPQLAETLYGAEPLSGGGVWESGEGMRIEMFSRDQARSLGEDLELWSKMPGWFAVGQDGEDALLCVESKSGRCALVGVDALSPGEAQELAPNFQELMRMGSWTAKAPA